ncbi:hypothetical protein FNV43_RR08401 [Rhamnella rubrinervis]|uniref:Methanol O-anthraniloyltransferase-like n=1 Tax=Rhamnella rubrinervis TaxID=2594499 RepID=A0A8K0MJ79_9ROSA|nr:hypothetical protein FNV43_RR08401 [Rhamnella rubrinervis]
MASPSSQIAIGFQVSRCKPELLVPAKPTPCEVKKLSDIDNQLRNHTSVIWFYKNNNNEYPSIMEGRDPVKVIREALSKALVYYYPLAGRVKEGHDGKLVVDCNGEGVLFVEAEADFKLEQLGHAIQPPFPFLNEVLYNVPGSDDILDCPLLLIQVTRLVCGGFILAVRLNHTTCDAFGLCQFMNTVGEIAQGAKHPTILPVWQRELLNARNPPQITRKHHEFQEEMADGQLNMDLTDLVLRPIVVNHNHLMAIRKHLPPHLAACSRFVLLTACLWRCRTIALDLDPEHVVQVSCAFNGRSKKTGLNLPLGYYGNAVVCPAAVSKAGDLCKKPLDYAVELVKNLKSEMNAEYIKSVADLTVIRGRPTFKIRGNFFVSDITKAGFGEVNFGWGYPEYAGPPLSYPMNCYYMNHRNKRGDGILVPLCLPSLAMERFQQELKKIIEIMALRKHLPPYLAACSILELLTACIWRCLTLALNVDLGVVRVSCVINGQFKDTIGLLGLTLEYYSPICGIKCWNFMLKSICDMRFQQELEKMIEVRGLIFIKQSSLTRIYPSCKGIAYQETIGKAKEI